MIKQISSICVLRLSALGDCINAFGMLCALKKANPELSLLWILDKRFAPLFRSEDGQDLIPMLPVDFSHGIIKAVKDLRAKLSHQSFDILLNMQTSLKSSLCSLVIKAHCKYGYDKERSREGQCFFINKRVVSPKNPHVLAGFMAFASQAGLGDLKPSWDFKLSANELAHFRKMSSNEKLFVIAPASAKAQKNWTAEGYASLADHAANCGLKTILVGSNAPSEQKLCAEIMERAHTACINLCGKTSLRSLAALLSQSSVVLSPDSASMHLASALQIPVIGLFAVHDPKRVGSWNYPQLQVSVYDSLASKECKTNSIPWRYRVKDEKAMTHIGVIDVIKAFDHALELSMHNKENY